MFESGGQNRQSIDFTRKMGVRMTDSDSVIFKVRILVAQLLKRETPYRVKAVRGFSFLLMTMTCVRECRKTPNSGKVRTAKPAARTFPEISFERV